MNKILATSTFLFVFIICSGFTLKDLHKAVRFEDNRLEVNFDRHLEFNDLVKIKLDLADRGISINYMFLEFDQNNGLEAIEFKVDCKDGFSGSAKTHRLTNSSRFGFFRDYSENAKVPFGTGSLE